MLYTFNIITFIVVLLVVLFGYEECMKLVMFMELYVKLLWIEYRTWRLRKKLEKELEGIDWIQRK